jgi:hypothetical protein
MPPRLRNALESLGRDNDALCWKIADKVAELNTWTISAGIQCQIFDVCNAAAIVMDTDYSAFRIYDFYLVGEKLSKPSHRKLVEPLPFSHLLYARQHSSNTENKITFLEIVNKDIALMDENQGRPVAKYTLEEAVTGKNRRRDKALQLLSNDDVPVFTPPINTPDGETSTAELLKSVLDAVEYVEKSMRALEVHIKNANESILLGRAVENIARGMTLAREFTMSIVEHLAE